MFKYLAILTTIVSSCGPVVDQDPSKTPPPLTNLQKEEFKGFLVAISDQIGAHAMVGTRDRTSRIKLSKVGEQIRNSLETHGCKLDFRTEQKDIPNGQEVKNKTEMLGVNCPHYRVERQDLITKNTEGSQMSVNGKILFAIKPNAGGLGDFTYQANFVATQIADPRGGIKTNYSSSGSGSISFVGGRYSFKVGNDANRDKGRGENRQNSWWEFKMGAYTAVLEQNRDSCKLNGFAISILDCDVMLTAIREVIDPVYFGN